MVLLDANILLHAYNAGSPHHAEAKRWLEGALSGTETVGIPWQVIVAFMRISTHARVFAAPFSIDEAVACVASWLGQPCVQPVDASDDCWALFAEALLRGRATGNLVPDAFLAMLARAYGATLISLDRDFARFDGLKWRDPLSAA